MRHNARYTAYGISGDPAPSVADVQITHLLRDAAKTVEITLLDHVVILSKSLGNTIYPKCRIMLSWVVAQGSGQSESCTTSVEKTWDNYWASRNDSSRENRSGPRRRRGPAGCSRSCMHSRFI